MLYFATYKEAESVIARIAAVEALGGNFVTFRQVSSREGHCRRQCQHADESINTSHIAVLAACTVEPEIIHNP